MPQSKSVEISGETWKSTLTPEEFSEWDKYSESHARIVGAVGYGVTLTMFLSHYRRGINLNIPVKQSHEI